MAVRIYIQNQENIQEAFEWLESRGLRYKILRKGKAVSPDQRVANPGTWRSTGATFGKDHPYLDDFYPTMRDYAIQSGLMDYTSYNHPWRREKNPLPCVIVYDEKEAIMFKMIYG